MSAAVAAGLYEMGTEAVLDSVASDARPSAEGKQPDPLQAPDMVNPDCPVSEATERNEELSDVVPVNAEKDAVVVISPAPFTKAMTFPVAAVTPPNPGATAGGAL